jgi:hypothetical protein
MAWHDPTVFCIYVTLARLNFGSVEARGLSCVTSSAKGLKESESPHLLGLKKGAMETLALLYGLEDHPMLHAFVVII